MNIQSQRKMKPRDMLRHESETQFLGETTTAGSKGPHRRGRSEERGVYGRTVSPASSWYLPVKGAFDLILGGLLLLIALPIMFVAAVLIKLTSRGPIFYSQVRLGKNGKSYTMYKLRTMVDKAEALTGPVWSSKDDARVTPLGRLLRKTHIDEFPQLWNVMRGEMSLIGPRPERPEFVAKLDWEIPCYRERLNVRPGITGFAQVRLPPDSDIESVRRKVVYDVYYVKNVSPWLDLRLLLVTAWSLACELGCHLWNRFALPNSETVEQGFLQAVSTECYPSQPNGAMTVGVPD